MAETGTLQLSGLDGVLEMLQKLPAEVVSKRGGPAKVALLKAARVIQKQAKLNVLLATSTPGPDGQSYGTGLIAKNVVATRGKAPPFPGERYLVRVRRAVYPGRNKIRGRKMTTQDTAFFLEYGSTKQPAEPWLRPAFLSKAEEAIRTFESEIVPAIDKAVQRYLKG